MARQLRRDRGLAFATVGGLLVGSILLNSLAFWYFDRSLHGDEPLGFGTSLWYSLISITTIGYGDYSARSFGARLSTFFFIIVIGLAVFSVFLGMAIDALSELSVRGTKGLMRVLAKDHILIVHFPSESRVKQLIDEIRSDPHHTSEEIIIVSDQIAELPFREPNVMFVRGSPHDADTYRKASAADARMAIVLSRSYDDPNSDAIVAAAVSVIDAVKPDIHIVAECMSEKHRELFKASHADAVVAGLKMAGNLLVQEVHDPGISRVMEVLTSNREGDTLYSLALPEDAAGIGYTAIASTLLAKGANAIAVKRADGVLTTFSSESVQTGDRLIYVALQRFEWRVFAEALGQQPA